MMASHDVHPAAMLLDPALWLITLAGTGIGAIYGLRFGPSIGETAMVGAVALGIMAAVPGFVAGLVVAWIRYKARQRAAVRSRFVAVLNAGNVDEGRRYLVSDDDPSALIFDLGDERYAGLSEAARGVLRDKAAQSVEKMLQENGAAFAAELRQNRFDRWIIMCNGETLHERRFD